MWKGCCRDSTAGAGSGERYPPVARRGPLPAPRSQDALPLTIPTPEPRLTRDHLEQLVTKMAARRVVVVGDAMLDIYLAGDAERIAPEAPVPVVTVHRRRAALGGAATAAATVAAIGAECRLVAVIGD